MEKVIMGTRLPAKLWLDEVEDSCMSQIRGEKRNVSICGRPEND